MVQDFNAFVLHVQHVLEVKSIGACDMTELLKYCYQMSIYSSVVIFALAIALLNTHLYRFVSNCNLLYLYKQHISNRFYYSRLFLNDSG